MREGDTDTAVNRAYYAMFNAARAALLSTGTPEDQLPRTHNGVIATFGQQIVQARFMDPELGRSFNQVESLRLAADYSGTDIDRDAAERAIKRAEGIVRTIEKEFGLASSIEKTKVAAEVPQIKQSPDEAAQSAIQAWREFHNKDAEHTKESAASDQSKTVKDKGQDYGLD